MYDVKLIEHIDGEWYTSEYLYRGKRITIKSRVEHGIKFHVWHEDKVMFTQRFRYATPDRILKRATTRIDMWIDGTWIPKKLKH